MGGDLHSTEDAELLMWLVCRMYPSQVEGIVCREATELAKHADRIVDEMSITSPVSLSLDSKAAYQKMKEQLKELMDSDRQCVFLLWLLHSSLAPPP
jgi:hypothetical protein